MGTQLSPSSSGLQQMCAHCVTCLPVRSVIACLLKTQVHCATRLNCSTSLLIYSLVLCWPDFTVAVTAVVNNIDIRTDGLKLAIACICWLVDTVGHDYSIMLLRMRTSAFTFPVMAFHVLCYVVSGHLAMPHAPVFICTCMTSCVRS